MMTLKAGTLFALHYEVVRVISAGGMGVVYEVFHRETKRKRALKVMLPHVLQEQDMRERFALEAVVTAEIESEHLVEVFDAGIDAETESPFIVMELLRGEDLGHRLACRERYTHEEVASYLTQASRALEKTHARGIVHRDLKPENLYITRRDDGSPRLKVLDFGIAKLIKSTGVDAKNSTRSFGTPYYMAREQLTGEARLIGPATDLYSLAHIAYTMLVGVPYFQDEGNVAANVLSLLMAVGQGTKEPASVRAARRDVTLPVAFDAWFARATQLDPAERFQRAAEMIAGLREVLDVRDARASSPGARENLGLAAIPAARSSSAASSAAPARGEIAAEVALGKTPLAVDSAVLAGAGSGRESPTRDVGATSQEAFARSALPHSHADPRAQRRTRVFIIGAGAVALTAGLIAARQFVIDGRAAPRDQVSASSTPLAAPTGSDAPGLPTVTAVESSRAAPPLTADPAPNASSLTPSASAHRATRGTRPLVKPPTAAATAAATSSPTGSGQPPSSGQQVPVHRTR